RRSPVMGWEGANVLFDTFVHPLVMGLEEHLLHMFRDDPEFHDGAGASHLGAHAPPPPAANDEPAADEAALAWSDAAERELKKIPFFVRGKARRNTESYARAHALPEVALDTLYDAKAWFDARRA
ncbi:MAG: ferredoxin:protochlorophyllide reductase (ATP-dependent) subunit B, partial [Caulobacteraceae bacterium]|nr:ferredoxin:protochlorophyllide reductase (ATP-dependent) subunit B [Caulobacter sp.]